MPAPVLTGYEHRVIVGIAEMAVTNNPNVILTTYSLGSCLGVAIYDPVIKVAGLLHLMLPDSSINPTKAATQPAMFVDTGVPALFRAAYDLHADRSRLVISVAGGAQIMDSTGFFNIGRRNYETLHALLQKNGFSIHAMDVGGLVNRTMYVKVATGDVTLNVSGEPTPRKLCRK